MGAGEVELKLPNLGPKNPKLDLPPKFEAKQCNISGIFDNILYTFL